MNNPTITNKIWYKKLSEYSADSVVTDNMLMNIRNTKIIAFSTPNLCIIHLPSGFVSISGNVTAVDVDKQSPIFVINNDAAVTIIRISILSERTKYMFAGCCRVQVRAQPD
jgi:hypothetical protein